MTKGTLNRSYRIKFRASKCGCAGIGRQAGLKIRWAYARGGSSPPTRTNSLSQSERLIQIQYS